MPLRPERATKLDLRVLEADVDMDGGYFVEVPPLEPCSIDEAVIQSTYPTHNIAEGDALSDENIERCGVQKVCRAHSGASLAQVNDAKKQEHCILLVHAERKYGILHAYFTDAIRKLDRESHALRTSLSNIYNKLIEAQVNFHNFHARRLNRVAFEHGGLDRPLVPLMKTNNHQDQARAVRQGDNSDDGLREGDFLPVFARTVSDLILLTDDQRKFILGPVVR